MSLGVFNLDLVVRKEEVLKKTNLIRDVMLKQMNEEVMLDHSTRRDRLVKTWESGEWLPQSHDLSHSKHQCIPPTAE